MVEEYIRVLSSPLGDLGRREPALEASEGAVGTYRRLPEGGGEGKSAAGRAASTAARAASTLFMVL